MGAGSGAGAALKTSAARAAPRERARAAQVETHVFMDLAGPLGPVIPLSPTRTGMGTALSPTPAAQTRSWSLRAQNVSNYERTKGLSVTFQPPARISFPFHIVIMLHFPVKRQKGA